MQITASVFGVGAPEALVVGVVALVVFGPRGLAEVRRHSLCCCVTKQAVLRATLQAVKSLGATLKTFQPTIREVLGVTQDLRNTLEEQIGLDDIRREFRGQGSVPPSWSSQGSQLRPSSSPDWDSPTGGSSEPPSLTRTAESLNGAGSSNGSVDSGSGGSSSHSPEASPSSSSPSHEGELEAMRKQSAAAAWGGQEPERRAQQSEGGSPAASPLAGLTLEDLEAELKRRKGGSKDRAAA